MSAHLWVANPLFCVGGSRAQRGRASHTEPHVEPPNHRASLRQKCFYCLLFPAGPTIFNQSTSVIWLRWKQTRWENRSGITHYGKHSGFIFPPPISRCHQLYTLVLVTYVRFILLFDISDSAQRWGNIFALFVAESTNGKIKISKGGCLSLSQSHDVLWSFTKGFLKPGIRVISNHRGKLSVLCSHQADKQHFSECVSRVSGLKSQRWSFITRSCSPSVREHHSPLSPCLLCL